jgi:hypothetical protein
MVPDIEVMLVAALSEERLQEGEHLDFKRELPPGDRANKSIAIDLASFALHGGTILIGVAERHPPTAHPVALKGLRERVEQIARASVDPPLIVRVREIPKPSSRRAGGSTASVAPRAVSTPAGARPTGSRSS